jgi:thioredoxin-dependent peroxiredoxin
MPAIKTRSKVPAFTLPTTGGGTWASHDRFAARETLPFPLLADTDERLCRLFDVIKPKSLYGRKYLGVERSTFLLDGTGRLRQEWRKVKVPGHAEAVLEAARSL